MALDPQNSNPYVDYEAVNNLSMFYGREQELQIIYGAIFKQQSISIIGSRHIGKSSLLKFLSNEELQRRYGYNFSRFLFVFTDWRAYLGKKREDFFQKICAQIILQSQDKVELHLPAYEGEDRFVQLLEDIRQAGFSLVLLMDAFDQVTSNPDFDARFFSFLRSLAGVSNLVCYVTATRKPLYEVCHSAEIAGSPFFNGFLPCPLGALTPAEARALISCPAELAQHPFTPAEIDWLSAQAGLHPFFLQIACRHLFAEKCQQANGAPVLARVQMMISQELLPHIDRYWEELAGPEREHLKHVMLRDTRGSQAYAEFSGSLLFRRRLRVLTQENLTSLSAEDVREALEHMDDTEFLSECQIGKLQYIATQIGTGLDVASVRRGVLVRDLLKKAFERMKPGDVRSETDLEWRQYNIFWYRYFKYHLPNQQIAARLSISVRQFYRELERALQSLWKEILEMESQTLDQLE